MAHAKSSVPAPQSSILHPTITNYFFHSSLISHKSLSPPLQVSLEFGVIKLQKPHFQKRYLDCLGDAVELGLVKAVGVSNYSEKRLCEAHAKLRGIPLASNQVNYSLIYRAPEENELGITLIAYSPIAQGALKGKYTPENPPTGPRRQIYTPEFLSELQSPLNRIKEIGEKYSKTNTQVVLNWLIAQDNVVPIPGAKNVEQAAEFAGALGWRLNSEEVAELRALATEIKPVTALLKNYKFLHEHRGCKFFYTKICTHFTSNANLTYLI